jgi:ATP phosphoribosyltransferase regulatory subunit
MSELEASALLPAGLRDVLPPVAAFEAAAVEGLLASVAGSGYERLKTPLVEFEHGLLSGAGAAMANDTFRLMDPVSQRMMGVRADITPQVARVALTRLEGAPRPLRLCYSGEVLRVRGTQLRPERQFAQVGAELIGAASAAADAEIVALAVEALEAVGLGKLSVDLTVPPLVPAVLEAVGIRGEKRAEIRAALDRKDASEVARLAGPAADLMGALLRAGGPAERCLAALDKLALPAAAAAERDRVREVLALLRRNVPGLVCSLDPVENRGFEYHAGVSFTLFAPGLRGEIGSGGRYVASLNGGARSEPATGFTLYVDALVRALPEPAPRRRLYLPFGTVAAEARRLRADGWVTLQALEPASDDRAEARRLLCTHVLAGGTVREVG